MVPTFGQSGKLGTNQHSIEFHRGAVNVYGRGVKHEALFMRLPLFGINLCGLCEFSNGPGEGIMSY